MALSRLFGKSSKKAASSPTADRSDRDPVAELAASEEEQEGFTVLGGNGSNSNRSSQVYPPLPAAPAGPAAAPAPPYSSATLNSQTSVTGGSHALDGVPFVLSPRCAAALGREAAGGGMQQDPLDADVRRVQDKLDSVSALLASANYDFRQEKNVVDQDISATMKRLHT